MLLGRTEEARQRLPELRRLAGRFEQVRSAFAQPELIYDYALVSMELATVLLKLGETARVRTLAEEVLRIFRSQQVPPQALVALRIFCDAAKEETATVELTRRLVRFLYRAKDDPELKFEAGAE